MTKQHVLPDRLKRLIPRIEDNHTLNAVRRVNEHGRRLPRNQEEAWIRNGNIGSVRLRVVCNRCNTRRLNDIEQAAFATLEDMLLGRPKVIGEEAQRQIATLTCAMVMMIEYLDRRSMSATPAERQHLIDTATPPPGWSFYLGRFPGGTGTMFRHTQILLDTPGYGSPQLKGQTSFIGLNEVVLHAYSVPIHPLVRVEPRVRALTFGLAPIWPNIGAFDWFELPALTHIDIHRIGGIDPAESRPGGPPNLDPETIADIRNRLHVTAGLIDVD